jgi:hypothetical protein
MNALVRTVLLLIIAFLMLVNLMLLAGDNTGPIEKMALACLCCCLSGQHFASAVALADIPRRSAGRPGCGLPPEDGRRRRPPALRHGCPHSVVPSLYANTAGFVILEDPRRRRVERGAYEATLASRAFVIPVCGRASRIGRGPGRAERHQGAGSAPPVPSHAEVRQPGGGGRPSATAAELHGFPVPMTGWYGPVTTRHGRRFQAAHGIPTTG